MPPEPPFHRGDRCLICGDLRSDERPFVRPGDTRHADCIDWRHEPWPAVHEQVLERLRVRHRALRELVRVTAEFGAWMLALRRAWPRGAAESWRAIQQWEHAVETRFERLERDVERVEYPEFVGAPAKAPRTR